MTAVTQPFHPVFWEESCHGLASMVLLLSGAGSHTSLKPAGTAFSSEAALPEGRAAPTQGAPRRWFAVAGVLIDTGHVCASNKSSSSVSIHCYSGSDPVLSAMHVLS